MASKIHGLIPGEDKTFIKINRIVLQGNNMDEDERLTIVRERTLSRMKKKTFSERVKAFVRRHIHVDGDKVFKVKKDAPSYDFLGGERIRTKSEMGFLHRLFHKKKKVQPYAFFDARPKKTLKGRAKKAVGHVTNHTKKAVGHVKGGVKEHFSFAHNNPAVESLGKWGRRWHRALHVLSFLIPVLILGYVVYMNVLPFGYSSSLSLDVGVDGDMDSTRDIYLSDPNNALTPVQRYGKDTFREVVRNEPFYLNFYAPIDITNRTRVTMDMDYESDSPVYIEYFDEVTEKTYWRRYYKPGYRPEMQGYVPVVSYGSETVYVKRELMEFKCRQLNFTHDCAQEWYWYKDWYFDDDATNVDDWLMENALYESVYFYNRLVNQEDYVNDDVGYVEGSWTEINASLRGTHEFYVYLNETLNLTVWKQDLNWYEGADDVSIELWSMDETRLICQDIILDDGIVISSKNKTAPIVKNVFCETEPEIYLLKIHGIRDKSSYNDYNLNKILINTNKIVTKGKILPVSKTGLYTDAKFNNSISFYYWHKGKNQDIIVEGEDNQTIILSKEDRYRTIQKSISGENILYFLKSDVVIQSELHFSFNKSNYFELFILNINDKNPNYFVYDGNYKSWIYKEDKISILGDNLKIKNIKLVFKHESI